MDNRVVVSDSIVGKTGVKVDLLVLFLGKKVLLLALVDRSDAYVFMDQDSPIKENVLDFINDVVVDKKREINVKVVRMVNDRQVKNIHLASGIRRDEKIFRFKTGSELLKIIMFKKKILCGMSQKRTQNYTKILLNIK